MRLLTEAQSNVIENPRVATRSCSWDYHRVDVTADLVAPCSPEQLFRWVDDLGVYPEWLDIVPLAVRADAHPDDPGPAWLVTLRGRLGPFARAKRLRMVRTVHEPPRAVRFERLEHDGRRHPAWVLRAEVVKHTVAHQVTRKTPDETPQERTSRLTMELYYGGSLGGPQVRKMLVDAIEQSRPTLLERVSGETTG